MTSDATSEKCEIFLNTIIFNPIFLSAYRTTSIRPIREVITGLSLITLRYPPENLQGDIINNNKSRK